MRGWERAKRKTNRIQASVCAVRRRLKAGAASYCERSRASGASSTLLRTRDAHQRSAIQTRSSVMPTLHVKDRRASLARACRGVRAGGGPLSAARRGERGSSWQRARCRACGLLGISNGSQQRGNRTQLTRSTQLGSMRRHGRPRVARSKLSSAFAGAQTLTASTRSHDSAIAAGPRASRRRGRTSRQHVSHHGRVWRLANVCWRPCAQQGRMRGATRRSRSPAGRKRAPSTSKELARANLRAPARRNRPEFKRAGA